ncbi:uncharacterized protein LOC115925499 [Strongylocentrotus purpuratus]|uniref:Uncharacterized protein n=1 Tax=Strongylocentrotus purpuratus TaxID=7668 RepID=A0A7M7P2T2_STRPU|nr:uncharacterized protein LOC115925499 [Strongylocentrotus purpuratus]
MHALIDEAFSLVGKTSPSRNAVVPLGGGLSNSQNYSGREEGKRTPRDHAQQEVPRQLFAPVMPPIPRRKPKDASIDGGTQTSEMGQTTRVVVVPVTRPPQEGSGVIWSPYTAGDETAMLSPSQEPASLPGGINPSPIPSPRGLNPSPIPSPRGVTTNHQQGLRERRPDGDSLRGNKQGVVERYADMLQEMLTSQLPLPPGEGDDVPSKSTPQKRSVTLLEGEPDYDWSFDHQSINGSQRHGSKTRSPLPDRTKPNKTEKDSASTSAPSDGKMQSLSNKEKGVGKAVDKFYDELDISTNLKYPTGQYSPQVANAVREELIRLTRKMGDGEESGLV